MKPALLTLDQAAARIGCSVASLRRLMGDGKCPGGKVAGRWRIDADVLEDWIADQRRPARTVVAHDDEAELPAVENPFS